MTATGRRPRTRCTLVLLALLALAGCALDRGTGSGPAGQVWREDEGRFVEPASVRAAVRGAQSILLGETHDVPAHHALQAELIRSAATGRRPAIVFEMIRRDQQGAIDQWRSAGADPAEFGGAVEWEQRGWPAWSMYQPIVEAAVALDLPILGAAPETSTLRQVGREGLASLEADRLAALRLNRPLPEAGLSRLQGVLRGSHCGVGGDAMVEAMLGVQRLRDAYLAETLRAAVREHGAAILIAGRGHTREDHGVPRYLDDAAAAASVTVGFAGTGEFADLETLRRASGGVLAQDYIWFTRGGSPAPPCDPDSGNAEGEG